ncbi:MAG: radical SAM protein [Chloroflexi bacterium]|nr:radical SAM protein [Chloroflexota bacterium]
MPFRWSLNPYRGCVHGCHYCYARATHPYLGLNADEDFETKIIVKTNMPEVLRREVSKPSWTRERVAIGTATDAYQPCEGRYRLTRRCLEILRDSDTPVSLVTKSTLVLRDLDLLSDLADGPGATVYFTITTLDDDLWRLIEPGTPPPLKRLQVLQRLSEAGVRTGVFLAPILPGITDSMESLEAVAAAARAHGAASFGSTVLRLAPLVKEHYFGFVAADFPDLLPRYERAYSGTNIASDYQVAIERRVARIRERHGFVEDAMHGRRIDAGKAVTVALPRSAGTGQLVLPL